MAEIFPFAKLNVDFDPETITILSNAFEDAWRRIEASNSPFARPAYANAARELVAKHILQMAQDGERDFIKLSDGAVAFLALNYKD